MSLASFRQPTRRGKVSQLRVITSLVLIAAGAMTTSIMTATQATAAASGGSWLMYGGNSARSSEQPTSPSLRAIRSRWTSPVLDGAVYGEPLIEGARVYVATENDTVYALNASSGAIVWSRHLGTPVPAAALPCGDISPAVGMTSTMIVDPTTGRLFASGSTDVNGVVKHLLLALSPESGKILFRRDLDQPGWTSPAELQRTGLGLDNGTVLVGFGGNDGDCGNYNGYLMGVPTSGIGATLVFKVATVRKGAIWAPSGVAVNNLGHIFLATGNGSSNSVRDAGDSVIELNAQLREISYFTPTEWLQDNEADLDLGSSSPILVSGNRVFVDGKEQTGYLLSAANLGGFGKDISSTTVCFSEGGDAYRASVVYVACPQASLTAVRISGNSMSVLWHAPGGINGSPTIAGGLVWAIGSGMLVGMRYGNGAVVTRAPVVSTAHFAAPSAGDGLLVVGGTSNVEAFEGPSGYRS
jgi:outer membrane protein assembly factor BamB